MNLEMNVFNPTTLDFCCFLQVSNIQLVAVDYKRVGHLNRTHALSLLHFVSYVEVSNFFFKHRFQPFFDQDK